MCRSGRRWADNAALCHAAWVELEWERFGMDCPGRDCWGSSKHTAINGQVHLLYRCSEMTLECPCSAPKLRLSSLLARSMRPSWTLWDGMRCTSQASLLSASDRGRAGQTS